MDELARSFTLEKVCASSLDFQDIVEEDFSINMFNEPPEMNFFKLKLRQSGTVRIEKKSSPSVTEQT